MLNKISVNGKPPRWGRFNIQAFPRRSNFKGLSEWRSRVSKEYLADDVFKVVRPRDGGLLWEEGDPNFAHRRLSPGRIDLGLVTVEKADGERRGHSVWGSAGG